MTDRPPLARLATDALAAERYDSEAPPDAARARAIARIAAEIEAQHARRRVRRVMVGALALAAASVGIFLGARTLRARHTVTANAPVPTLQSGAVGHTIAGGVVVLHEGRELSLDTGTPLSAGDRLIAAANGRAAIMFPTGTHVVVEGGADVVLLEQGAQQVFSLRAGAVRADVAKLAPGQRFVVRTLDAEVEVRGTTFKVALVQADPTCGAGTLTRVEVTEGLVLVRAKDAEVQVPAGESWPKGCGVTASIAPNPAPPATMMGKPVMPSVPVKPTVTAPVTPPAAPTSGGTAAATDLPEQNALFQEAMNARKRGDNPAAIATFERFMAKYPSSVLAESAAVERMRLLAASDKARGAAAAKDYLARFPKGFARAEAEAIIGGP